MYNNCVGIVLGNVWYDVGRDMWPFITFIYVIIIITTAILTTKHFLMACYYYS